MSSFTYRNSPAFKPDARVIVRFDHQPGFDVLLEALPQPVAPTESDSLADGAGHAWVEPCCFIGKRDVIQQPFGGMKRIRVGRVIQIVINHRAVEGVRQKETASVSDDLRKHDADVVERDVTKGGHIGVKRLIKSRRNSRQGRLEIQRIRRLAHRARALEVVKLPEEASMGGRPRGPFRPQVVTGGGTSQPANDVRELPVLGKIAAGTPISAIQHEKDRIPVPEALLGSGEHYVLEVSGDSMINAGILDGDMALIRKSDTASSGEIVVALVEGEEATLKRLRKRGASIALEAANPAYETRIFGPDQVEVQGKLVGLIRRYH